MTAQSRGWGPPPTPRTRIDQAKASMSGAEFPGGIHQDLVALWLTLVEITERRGYLCVVGWCWGYANRKVRGSQTTWSNHAWGLAGDINAPRNPMSTKLVTDMPSWMPKLWEKYGFRWGGRYKTRPDAMHYEYMGTPAQVSQYLEAARKELASLVSTPTKEEDEIMRPPETSERVRQWKHTVNRLLALTGGGYDGGGLEYTKDPLGRPVAPGSRYLIADDQFDEKTVEASWHAIARAERWVLKYPVYAGAGGHRNISPVTQAFVVAAIERIISESSG